MTLLNLRHYNHLKVGCQYVFYMFNKCKTTPYMNTVLLKKKVSKMYWLINQRSIYVFLEIDALISFQGYYFSQKQF